MIHAGSSHLGPPSLSNPTKFPAILFLRRIAIYRPMRIIGLAGWSGSGKTTLLAKIIPRLVARGYTVSTVKHAHHGFDVDTPGKDSHTHRMAERTQVRVASSHRSDLVTEL